MDELTPSDLTRASGDEPGGSDIAETPSTSFTFTSKLTLVSDPDSPTAESIRSLRTVLLTNHLKERRRSLAVCAPAEGSGCSFIAANLAVGMAQIGVNTLLVDANLRNPSIHEYIEPSGPVVGLSECLRDDAMPTGQMVCAIQPTLSVIYAGAVDPGLQDQIARSDFKSLMGTWLRDYDLTIVDTPPTNRYADARRISSVAHYAMVVACRERSFVKDIQVLLDELETDRTVVVGSFLNDY